MKLTRAQEEMLIQIGLDTLLKHVGPVRTGEVRLVPVVMDSASTVGKRPRGRGRPKKIVKPTPEKNARVTQPRKAWTQAHREKFYATLAQKRQEQMVRQEPEPVATPTE